ncbi:YciI family protein [Streptomyces sp. NPDC018693]|uniref:YciI family protein n=1 Tax=unclassified Streptomyces TaxID=2593676 RepID=UPI003795FD77
MTFYVHAQDRPAVADRLIALSEAHWSYMDRFADRLVLRGPTLSADGEEHTGSVHVVDLPDRESAERFATEEPFWRAGLYESFTATRAEVLLNRGRTPADDTPLSLVTARWSPRPRPGAFDLDGRLTFAAVLADDARRHTTGIVTVVAALPDEARKLTQPLADHLAGASAVLTGQRWCHGGRPNRP